ncbi:ABC transporter permease subunit [Haloglomus salinum]|jgi:ABC-2 type transport system permease protein|uniref:ABC transporter permease subunit n=1 Tax=Haloglomus salinum TaxID=2962673 RepID=UPI0020C9E8E3|nr:ABC transporter permease subunit [Haloglomus salinum]
MSLAAVFRKDFEDAVRSYSLLVSVLLFGLFAALLAALQFFPTLYIDDGSTAPATTLALLNSMRQPAVFFVPLFGLMVAYDTIVGERESGSIRLLLGLPNSRLEAVLGKFLGRTSVVAAAVLAGYAVAGAIALATYDSFDTAVFTLFTLLTLVYGAVYVAIATGFSAGMRSRLGAFVGAGGLYFLFIIGWDIGLLLLQLAIYGQDIPEAGLPDWFSFIGMLNPSTAFMHAARTVIPAYREITFYPEASAAYAQGWVGFPILAVWIVLPLAFGYLRFQRFEV